jgi:hypothetical protein
MARMEGQPEGARDDAAMPPKPGPGEAADPLYASAYQLARFYAILSPGLLQRELDVDRARAERLIALLVERGVLGPVMIEHSGARESRVNMILETAQKVDLSPNVPTSSPRAGRLAVLVTGVSVLLGVGVCVGLIALGVGPKVAGALGLALVSQSLAAIAGLLLIPAAGGALVAWLAESLLSPDEGQVPYRALQVRRSLWTVYALLSIGYGSLQLFR